MDIKLIDEFRRRTNASYDEAKYYLEKYNGDLLEAIIAFERERSGFYYKRKENPKSDRFANGLIRLIQRLVDIKLVITDRNFQTFSIPIIVPLVLFPFWHIFIILAIVMYFIGYRFSLKEMPDPNINVASIAEKIKNKMKDNGTNY